MPWARQLRHTLLVLAAVATAILSAAQAQPSDADLQRLQELDAQAAAAYRAGHYAEGVAAAEAAYRLAERVFGPRHPDTLASLNNVAFLYGSQGRHDEAKPLYEQALQLQREVLGETHPDTLTSLNNLALLLASQGRSGEAEPLFEQALQLRRKVLGDRHPDTLGSLNNLAAVYESQGRYGEAMPLYERALQLRREVLGDGHPDTLGSLNNLAGLYAGRGRYGEAQSLYERVLQVSREVLGESHPHTLTTLNNLAELYKMQGRYDEAEPLHERALQLRREVLGDRHPDTLASLNGLAGLYALQGRYGEAEPLHQQALQLGRDVLGDSHPDTIRSLTSLALLYESQGRYGDAEPLYERALRLRRYLLGDRHPDTLTSFNNLAALYEKQGRYGGAEPLYEHALQIKRDVLGETHPDTLVSLNNLAGLYARQGRHNEAEPLQERALQVSREVLGDRHPNTLASLNNLAGLYARQGRHGEAAPLFEQVLHLSSEELGKTHPRTLATQLNTAVAKVNSGDAAGAVKRLRQLEPQLLSWLGSEIYSTERAVVRRGLLASQSAYQEIALSLAALHPRLEDAQVLAVSAVLRFKGLQAEEEAWLARLIRRGDDPAIQTVALQIKELREQLARAHHGGANKAEVGVLAERLETAELALGRISRAFERYLQVRNANVEDLRGALNRGMSLVEFRLYRPFDFGTVEFGASHWAAVVVQGFDRLEVIDLGAVADTLPLIEALVANDENAEEAARVLFTRLIEPLDLAGADTVVLAPDGALSLVPFHRLRMPDGRLWAEQAHLRTIQTGRDLLRLTLDHPAKGLLALGGIDFDAAAPVKMATLEPAAGPDVPPGSQTERVRSVTEGTFRKGFARLPGSGEEVAHIAALYGLARPEEPVRLLTGMEADEGSLERLDQPPRVLHLATHGFYRAPEEPADRPMVLAGVALAGANQALRGEAEGGILYAIEAQNLNLEGTELVVLSACETAQGQIDYSEGVYGLVRALRTAGAQNVLVTLRPVGDLTARDFMIRFYTNWLTQEESDPALALQETQREYIRKYPEEDWTPFVLIGGASS